MCTIAYDQAAVCSGAACVLDFFSGELDVGPEQAKLHIVAVTYERNNH